MKESELPASLSIEDIKVRIRETNSSPNVGLVNQVVLREGPRAFRFATLMEIIDPNTKEVHHHVLLLESYDRLKNGWFGKPEKSIRLEDNQDEIRKLFKILQAHYGGKFADNVGELHVITGEDYKKLENLITLIPVLSSPDMVEIIKLVIPRVEDIGPYLPEVLAAFEKSNPETITHIAAAARLTEFKSAFAKLQKLIEDGDNTESHYQNLLTENPWIFGSEYNGLLERRRWVRDQELDFLFRCTSDNYYEIVEIKTPFVGELFLYDSSHKSYYPSASLSPVVGQVMSYIAELERNRNSILSQDGCDFLKIRAKIIIGRDSTPGVQEALRNLNGHLHNIEILTFDQLSRIGKRVLNLFIEGITEVNDSR